MDEILANARTVDEILADMVEPIIGDTPVSVQLATALNGMASKEDVNALSTELKALRKEVEKLIELVGDISVSEQINMVMQNNKQV